MEELEYITKEAMIQCSEGSAPGLFSPTYNQTTKINSCLVSTKVDKISMANVPSFIICKKTQKPCIPVSTEWQNTYPVKIKGQQTLIGKSCMNCGIGGKIEFLSSGQVPLSAEEKEALKGMRDDAQKAFDAEQKEKNKPWWQKAGEFVVDCVPIVGPIVSLVKNVSEGNWAMAALDVGFLALDVVGVAAAPFTGGGSLAASTVAKVGIKQAIKAGAKQVAKKVSKEALEAGVKQTAEMLSKLSVRSLTKGKLCVFACFPAGTPVHVEGGIKHIETLKVGDKVWSFDESTGIPILKSISNIFERSAQLLVDITVEDEVIQTTPEHPFFVNGDWKEAGLIEVGDKILQIDGVSRKVLKFRYTGAHAPVESLAAEFSEEIEPPEEDAVKVYNFEVEECHTYFVGHQGVLVHNASKKGICLKEGVDKFRRSMAERRKTLLRDAKDPKSELSDKARDFIKKNDGNKVPKGHEVSHEKPLYTRTTPAGKRKLDKASNMKTQQKAVHRKRHKECGDQYHKYGPANKPKNPRD
ncbi:intein C-terminal splicing region/intein N-terminal splicing region [Pedobacter steynii]|uniref:Intein C-terminal splicing region/intein N-terminal splicing region n=1 Tax=Pedobacter steynii TaxID=430522 RepID=A0A1G9RT67_9SPHI|nr:polymorphic toxin-type HINT domain-containing protein [Pedobacter steynii]NQX37663.1 DUF4280 domain-containing protein [Pedobacter steynii]SDM26167.1 intein C-terminal splicing region/intein N-terminal splicing region [Pedobacter steynii]